MKRLLRGRRRAVVGITALAGLAAGAVVAYAAIPDSNGLIHGCYTRNSGALRVIDTDTGQTCGTKETALNWSQTGPQGPRGPQGPQGPAGESGASAVFGRIDELPTSGDGLAYVTGVTPTLGTRVEREITWPNATFVARDLHVFVMTPPGEGNTWTFTLEVGGIDTPLTCTIGGTQVSCNSGSTTATVFNQDVGGMAFRVTATGSPPAAIATFGWRASLSASLTP